MSPLLALRLVTYLTVADGIAALLLAGLIAPLGAGLVGAAVAGELVLERARERGAPRRHAVLGPGGARRRRRSR